MRAATALLAVCISSCALPDYSYVWHTGFLVAAGPQPVFAVKPVVKKQKPAVLLAYDGSVCRTSVERFRGTAVGKWVACDWQLPDPEAQSVSHGAIQRVGDAATGAEPAILEAWSLTSSPASSTSSGHPNVSRSLTGAPTPPKANRKVSPSIPGACA